MFKDYYLYLHTYSLRFHLAYKKGFDVFAFIDQAAKEGFDGVCISANNANYRHLGGLEPWRFKAIKEHLLQYNLLCDIDTSATQPEHLKTMLHVAKEVSAQQLRTYTRYQGKISEIIEQTIKDLKEVAPIAQDLGITLMLENHETFTGLEIAQILEMVNQPFIKALYDYGNSQMVLEDPLECLKALAPYASSAHLKDHVMIEAKDSPDGKLSVLGVPIGKGYLPILEITKGLLKAGCKRIVFENSFAYRARVKESRMTPKALARLGKGSFRFAADLNDEKSILLYPERFDTATLIDLEASMHKHSLEWLQRQFEEL